MLPDPYNLNWRTRGIRERTQQIERGADAELAPNLCNPSGCLVKKWRVNETDPVLIEAAFNRLGCTCRVDAERFEHIGTSTGRCRAPRAVFCYRHTAARVAENRSGRDIERFPPARSRSIRCDRTLLPRMH